MNRSDPTRSAGWGGGWTPPQNDLPPASQRPASYSYLDSAGYCQLTLQKAQVTFGPKGATDFTTALAKLPKDDKRFDISERAALLEIARTPLKRLQELGIVRTSDQKPGDSRIDCC